MITGNYSRNENYQVARDVGGEEPTESDEGDDVATSRDEAEHGGDVAGHPPKEMPRLFDAQSILPSGLL